MEDITLKWLSFSYLTSIFSEIFSSPFLSFLCNEILHNQNSVAESQERVVCGYVLHDIAAAFIMKIISVVNNYQRY